MSSARFFDVLGSAAFSIALVSMLLLFVPGLVRADLVDDSHAQQPVQKFIGCADH